MLIDFKYRAFKNNDVTLGEETIFFNTSMNGTDIDSQKKVIAIIKAFEGKSKAIKKGAKHFLKKLFK
ncbi:MAG: hypothetical protein ABR595_00490 [Psychroflexus sp.]